MKVIVGNVVVGITQASSFIKKGITDEEAQMRFLQAALKKKLKGIIGEEKFSLSILRRSVDARKEVKLIYSLCVDISESTGSKIIKKNLGKIYENDSNSSFPRIDSGMTEDRPVVIGFGPAGMMCAYYLSKHGLRPIIIERGENVDERSETVKGFWKGSELNEDSNVQFGEGGAGTFSDGKLTSRSKDRRGMAVLNTLVEFGAPKDILYSSKPHVGTDLLKGTVKGIREEIKSLGGEFYFSTRLERLEKAAGEDRSYLAVCRDLKGDRTLEFRTMNLVLAIGHSARDTFTMLDSFGVKMTPKPFAVGVRIEHKRKSIDISQYGSEEAIQTLGAAEYFLTHNTGEGRGVYTFCMCPGGMVVPASSQREALVVNGMSYHARDMENSNSAVLVSIQPRDYEIYGDTEDDVLSGMKFQVEIEKKAFKAGGSNYHAPVQRVGDFLNKDKLKEKNENDKVKPSYPIGTREVDFEEILPEFVIKSLKEALPEFGKKLKGFDDDDAVITAVETRTSSPVRIVRDEITLESVSNLGIYPCGEGAGYSGGIVSGGIDGIKVAEKIIEKYSKNMGW